jgi:hypothetical protein
MSDNAKDIEHAREGHAAVVAEMRAPLLQEIQRWWRMAHGGRVWRVGRSGALLPYGYTAAAEDVLRRGPDGEAVIVVRRGDVVVDPEAACVVRRIFALRRRGLSAGDIAFELALAHTRTTNGGVFFFVGVQQILRHEHLYRTGTSIWGGITAQQRWPTIL